MKKTIITILTWIVLVGCAVWAYPQIIQFVVFPESWKTPFLIIGIVCLGILLGLIYYFSKKTVGAVILSLINILLSGALVLGTLYLPSVEKRMGEVISKISDTEIVVMDVYALSPEYKQAHPDIFQDIIQSDKLSDYNDASVAFQHSNNEELFNKTIEALSGKISANLLETGTIWESLEHLYNNDAQAIVVPDSYLTSISELETYRNFESDAVLLDTLMVQMPKEQNSTDLETQKHFSIFVAGSDTRSPELSIYGRTDVDIMLTVDPVHKQALIVSIPRDYYIHNPALGGLDKLTHLGNDGITNTMNGLNQFFGINMDSYAVVNFQTFTQIVDAIGGIDVDNPYAFTSNNGRDVNGNGYTFNQGMIHLDGNMALAYVRERYNLENGDMDRIKHQTIVLEAILDKITSNELLIHFDTLLNSLKGAVATNISIESVYKLASDQLADGGDWNIVSYHLIERGDMLETVSMPGQLLYVGHPIDSQVQFVRNEINCILSGEILEQKEIPME